MKIKIKYYNGELSDYLTYGKVYEATHIAEDGKKLLNIVDDDGFLLFIYPPQCPHLNDGKWEIVEE